MSLNWREIDKILSEIPLENSFIRQIHQPRHHQLIFELYHRGRTQRLFFSFSNPNCRLHLLNSKIPNPRRPQRFASFLRAHIRDGRIQSAGQMGRERIVKFVVTKSEARIILWVRLWAAAANMIVTTEDGRILDALYRRPKRGEISGGSYDPERQTASTKKAREDKPREYTVRELPGEGLFNEKIERHYSEMEHAAEGQKLLDQIGQQFDSQEQRIAATIQSLEKKLSAYQDYTLYKRYGDLILSRLHTIIRGQRWLVDPEAQIEIELNPELKPSDNAEAYYTRYRKAKRGREKLHSEIQEQKKQLHAVRSRARSIIEPFAEALAHNNLQEKDLAELRGQLKSKTGSPGKDKNLSGLPGLSFRSFDFDITVGRTAKENDALLRKMRGNDSWFHARDYAGAYVFVKSIPGKSIPLEVMLDAGSLALFYSKGRSSGRGDVYYTQVKYLRRVKKGKTGLVIPTQEKNLHIKIQPERMTRLREA